MRRFPKVLALPVSAAALLLFSAIGWGQSIERVRVASPARPVVEKFPPGVSLVLVSPPDYVRGSVDDASGTWVGPSFRATGNPSLGGKSLIRWSVGFDDKAKDSEAAALSALTKGWRESLRGGVSVPHVVGRRTVGTIDGDFILTISPGSGDAAHEATVGFAIAPGIHATARFLLLEPADERAGSFGEYLVLDSIAPVTWNRGQAFRSVTGIRLDGNLPPTRVTARASDGGRTLRGAVADSFRHPLIGAGVGIERQAGENWQKVASTKTDAKGAYIVRRLSRRGLYRAVATVGSASATSPGVRAGA